MVTSLLRTAPENCRRIFSLFVPIINALALALSSNIRNRHCFLNTQIQIQGISQESVFLTEILLSTNIDMLYIFTKIHRHCNALFFQYCYLGFICAQYTNFVPYVSPDSIYSLQETRVLYSTICKTYIHLMKQNSPYFHVDYAKKQNMLPPIKA